MVLLVVRKCRLKVEFVIYSYIINVKKLIVCKYDLLNKKQDRLLHAL